MRNQTDTTMFTCFATYGKTYKTRKFYTVTPYAAKQKAQKWFKEMEKKAA